MQTQPHDQFTSPKDLEQLLLDARAERDQAISSIVKGVMSEMQELVRRIASRRRGSADE